MISNNIINSNFYKIANADVNGNVTGIHFSNAANLSILGGSTGAFLQTDGSGLLSFSTGGDVQKIFNFGDASPSTIATLPSGATVTGVQLVITTALNDTGATISIGTGANANLFLATTDNLPYESGTYSTEPAYKLSTSTPVVLTINPGTSSVGNGVIVLSYQ